MKTKQKNNRSKLTSISQKWLKKLNQNLSKISKKERADFINNYRIQIIDELKQGKKEQEIINSFEPISDIVNNIYHELEISNAKKTVNSVCVSFFTNFAKLFTWTWFWILLGIFPLILTTLFIALTIGSVGGFFFSFAAFKSYSGFIAFGVVFGFMTAWLIIGIISFFLAAICQKILYFFCEITIKSFNQNAKVSWTKKNLFSLSRKMWWKVWAVILILTIALSVVATPLMLTKGGAGYNMINGIYDNSQLIMDDMDKNTFETQYFNQTDGKHIYLDLAASRKNIGADEFISTTSGDQVVNVNGKNITIKQNDIAIIRKYNTSREYQKVTLQTITKFNKKSQQNEKILEILGKQKTPNGEFCWEDLIYSFGIEAAYYVVYSPYDKTFFDKSDFNNLN